MMDTLRDSLKNFPGLRFLVDDLQLSSAPARRLLLATTWTSDIACIEQRLDEISERITLLLHPDMGKGVLEIANLLTHLRMIVGSLETLASGGTCSDIDFFELKGLALLESKIRHVSQRYQLPNVPFPSLTNELDLLDPEGHHLSPFFLSDKYSEELASLRKKQQKATTDEERTKIALLASDEEERVRRRLSKALRPSADKLMEVYNSLAKEDVLIAKARWALKENATRPKVLNLGTSELTEVWHPQVKSLLEQQGHSIQPVSIAFNQAPVLITGANMAGKSVLLSTIALAQVMMQYGFYVAARKASLVAVDAVMTSISDAQDTSQGLSSYAGEILCLDAMIKEVKNNKKLLLLIDEAARTTNPEEGRALIEALVTLFAKYKTSAIITTHYSGIKADAKRYRVKGFIEERVKHPLEVNQLNKCMDYQLVETQTDDAPQEAIRIAEILGVDEELLLYSKASFSEHSKSRNN